MQDWDLLTSCDHEPLEGEFFSTPDGSDPADFCADAPLAITAAQIALANVEPAQQAELCDALIAILNTTIDICGDETGLFQSILDDLGTDCMIDTDGGDDDNLDPIVGEWQFIRSVDFLSVDSEILIDEEFLADDCSEQSRQFFEADGSYTFLTFDNPNGACELLNSTAAGNWSINNGFYQVIYDNMCIGLECPGQAQEPTSATLIDTNKLRIQFGEDIDDETGTAEFFFREFTRL